MKSRLTFPREVLLVEVERWCGEVACNALTRLSLTKAEARAHTGFECARCGRWNPDALSERDIPEWWEELRVTSLEGLKPPPGAGAREEDAGEVVTRLSDAWKSLGDAAGDEGKGGGTF